MKHPFHSIKLSTDGKSLYAASVSSLQKFDLTNGKLVATYNVVEPKTQEDKKEEKEEEKSKEETTATSPPRKKVKIDEKSVAETKKTEINSSTAGEGPKCVRYIRLSRNGEYVILITTDNKSVVVLNANDLSLVSKRTFPKRPSVVTTTFDDSNLIVGDKFGDVYSVPLTSTDSVIAPSDGKTEDQASIDPILGHVSMLTDAEIVSHKEADQEEEFFILTADRDEHIRVSRYPKAYLIERWLFGHDEFVSTIVIPSWAPDLVISGGGDDNIYLFRWDVRTKEDEESPLLDKIDIRQYVGKYLTPEFHSAPLRKKDTKEIEEKKKKTLELTVAKIVLVEKYQQLVVHCEATNALVVLKLVKNDEGKYKLEYLSTFERPNSRIVSVDGTQDGKLVLSLENNNEEVPLLELYQITEDGKVSLFLLMMIDYQILLLLSANVILFFFQK